MPRRDPHGPSCRCDNPECRGWTWAATSTTRCFLCRAPAPPRVQKMAPGHCELRGFDPRPAAAAALGGPARYRQPVNAAAQAAEHGGAARVRQLPPPPPPPPPRPRPASAAPDAPHGRAGKGVAVSANPVRDIPETLPAPPHALSRQRQCQRFWSHEPWPHAASPPVGSAHCIVGGSGGLSRSPGARSAERRAHSRDAADGHYLPAAGDVTASGGAWLCADGVPVPLRPPVRAESVTRAQWQTFMQQQATALAVMEAKAEEEVGLGTPAASPEWPRSRPASQPAVGSAGTVQGLPVSDRAALPKGVSFDFDGDIPLTQASASRWHLAMPSCARSSCSLQLPVCMVLPQSWSTHNCPAGCRWSRPRGNCSS